MERAPVMRRGAALLLAGAAAIGAGATFAWRSHRERGPLAPAAAGPAAGSAVGAARHDVPAAERAPDGVRIRVQVLNATRTRGLARRGTLLLRDRGFDVVETGTASVQRDSVLVLDLSGHPDWAARVAKAMGGARVESRPDSSRYLDVSVLIGAAWRPPAEPFHP